MYINEDNYWSVHTLTDMAIFCIFRRIKIWSAEDGSCPVTLTGHTAAVTDTAIVDKGMNVVSTSKLVS